jgi:hypothetical protein
MTVMLDIAGGILIAALTLGAFSFGIHLATWRDPQISSLQLPFGARALGWACILAAAVFVFWLVLVRTEVIHWQDLIPR